MTGLSNEPTQPSAVPKRKARWVTPRMRRLAADDAKNGGTVNSDGYVFDLASS